jgi:NADH dehydrogenase
METEELQGHPMMAQPALQQGKLLGRNIVELIQNKAMEPFEYNDKDLATIGRNKAVDLPNYHFSGVFAWFVWMCFIYSR